MLEMARRSQMHLGARPLTSAHCRHTLWASTDHIRGQADFRLMPRLTVGLYSHYAA